jgi:hypothetical protein
VTVPATVRISNHKKTSEGDTLRDAVGPGGFYARRGSASLNIRICIARMRRWTLRRAFLPAISIGVVALDVNPALRALA